MNNIAAWDPATSTWSSLGTGSANGVNGQVDALAALDGTLYVGGWFTTAGGATANHVAVWDPATTMSRCGTPRRTRGRPSGRGARTGSTTSSTPSPRSTARSTSAAA
ncbi:MAG: hypothetical protein ACYTE2_11140 [Planctomycetota bacterium]